MMGRKRMILTLTTLLFLATGCSTPSTQEPTAVPTRRPMPAVIPTETPTAVPTITPAPRPEQTGTDAATFLKETYTDYSILAPGEKFVKTWDVKNIGTRMWNANYRLVLDATPQNDALGSPAEIHFPGDIPPGGTVTLLISLSAPKTPGTYSVYWKLENDRGETFGVDGDRVWVTIIVCEAGKTCSPPTSGGSTSANGLSATLTGFSSGAQSASASFCMTLPNRNYDPVSVSLRVDDQTFSLSSGGMLEVGCYEFEFPVTAAQIEQAKTVAVSIDQVRMLGGVNDPQGVCETARLNLRAQYPGLDFQCSFSMAGYYTDLQLPAGMTRERANQIIMDAVEGAIYGPWVLNIK